MNGFNVNDLIKKKDLDDPEWFHSEERIATLIRNSAKAQGLRLRAPNPNCKKCHGRGWIALNAVTGDPIVCRCIFYPEDLENRDEIPEEDRKPRNRAERRKKSRCK